MHDGLCTSCSRTACAQSCHTRTSAKQMNISKQAPPLWHGNGFRVGMRRQGTAEARITDALQVGAEPSLPYDLATEGAASCVCDPTRCVLSISCSIVSQTWGGTISAHSRCVVMCASSWRICDEAPSDRASSCTAVGISQWARLFAKPL